MRFFVSNLARKPEVIFSHDITKPLLFHFRSCKNGTLEKNFTNCETCDYDQWQCSDMKRCLNKNQICDGIVDCQDGTDEDPKSCSMYHTYGLQGL